MPYLAGADRRIPFMFLFFPPPLSKHPIPGKKTKKLSVQLLHPSSPLPFFLGFLVTKKKKKRSKMKNRMQTGNDRLALGLLQREKKPTLPQLNLF